jgi:uncharacterized membrane protein YqjE
MARADGIRVEVASLIRVLAITPCHGSLRRQNTAAEPEDSGRTADAGSCSDFRVGIRSWTNACNPQVAPLMNQSPANGRTVSEILSDMKNELQEFAQTRIELFRKELRERAEVIKSAIPLAVAGALFLTTAFFLFSFALVGLLAAVFGSNPYRWFLAALIVGVVWAMGGGTAAFLAKQRFSKQSLMPQKTMQVLSGDKVWLQKETRKAS